jgi:hypothetical protein
VKHGGIVRRGTVVLPYGIKTVLGCTPLEPGENPGGYSGCRSAGQRNLTR